MSTVKINPQTLHQFAYEVFQQEFPFKLYLKDGHHLQPTSPTWINHYYHRYQQQHPHAKIINFNNPQIIQRYIQQHYAEYQQLMISLDKNPLKQQGDYIQAD